MLIFTNCLSETADEGCLKVANSLIKRIKKTSPDVTVVSYEIKTDLSDIHVKSNKLLLTAEIIRTVSKRKDKIFYVPFPARSSATALRIFMLSVFARKKVSVLLTQVTDVSFSAKMLLKFSGADLFVLSNDTKAKLEDAVGKKRIVKIKAGVQTDKFVPVTKQQADDLKKKYGFSADKPVVLHVGHMNEGRNISQLMKISEKYQIVLVTSTLTKNEENKQLKARLSGCPNIKIIDEYIPDIHEIYQMSDVYFFPVVEEGNCIDVPLSCLEAAACNKPIVTTDFGEMKEFKGRKGFGFIQSFEMAEINRLIDEAVMIENPDTRSAVCDYDWSIAVRNILDM